MTHQLVAAVWEQLGRHDIANILHEIVGQHAADLALLQFQEGLVSDIEPLTRAVFWIKSIFDLQRSYLQGMAGVENCHPYLVPYLLSSELVFSTIMYLIQVKQALFPSTTTGVREFSKHRYFIAQTLLSGVRILMLRKEFLHSEKKYNLERAIRAAWQHSGLSEAEKYLVSNLLPQAIDHIESSDSADSQRLWTVFDQMNLPSFLSGLYPLNIEPEILVSNALALLRKGSVEQTASFWMLFDVLWAAESALIQCHVDRRRYPQEEGYSSKAAIWAEEASEHIEEIRRNLVVAIFEAPMSTEYPILSNLTSTLISWEDNDTLPKRHPNIYYSLRHLVDVKANLESSLGHFLRWLINRRVQLWDCNGELEAVSREYHRTLQNWMQSTALPESEHQRGQGYSKQNIPIYVVNCPAVHPVPKDLLEERLKGGDRHVYEMHYINRKQQLQENSPFIAVDTFCPLCPADTKIQHARLIEPLGHLSTTLGRTRSDGSSSRHSLRVSGEATSRSDTLSHSTSRSSTQLDVRESPKTPLSLLQSSPTLSKATADKPTVTISDTVPPPTSPAAASPLQVKRGLSQAFRSSRDLKGITKSISNRTMSLKRKSSKENPLPRRLRFCFSSLGTSLLVWVEDGDWLMRFDVSSADGTLTQKHRYDVSGVHFAAAGHNLCAMVSSAREHHELLILNGINTTLEAFIAIDTPQRNRSSICMAVSRDDRYVAFTLNDQVLVYQIGNGSIRRVILAEQTDVYQVRVEQQQQRPISSCVKRPLTLKEAAQESQRQKTVIERKLSFSPDAKHLIVATHLGDHHVYLDVWDCATEPWTIKPGYSRSFKLPPWTTNDGDITSIFYDRWRRAAFLTGFFGKEYPALIPIPGYDELVSEPYSTKILHAAQSPSGSRYTVANSMHEIYLFDYNPNGTLNPCRLKRATSKMGSASFKPGEMVLSFPQENVVLAFWMKDEKLVLRTIAVGDEETFSDYDIRPDYDQLILERPATLKSPFDLRNTSKLSNESIAEMPSSPVAELSSN